MPAYDAKGVRLPHFSPATVRKVALASVVCFALLILSGGAVRLTGSGLGCPDWPRAADTPDGPCTRSIRSWSSPTGW